MAETRGAAATLRAIVRKRGSGGSNKGKPEDEKKAATATATAAPVLQKVAGIIPSPLLMSSPTTSTASDKSIKAISPSVPVVEDPPVRPRNKFNKFKNQKSSTLTPTSKTPRGKTPLEKSPEDSEITTSPSMESPPVMRETPRQIASLYEEKNAKSPDSNSTGSHKKSRSAAVSKEFLKSLSLFAELESLEEKEGMEDRDYKAKEKEKCRSLELESSSSRSKSPVSGILKKKRTNSEEKIDTEVIDFKLVPTEPEDCVEKTAKVLELLLKGQFEGIAAGSLATERIADCLKYVKSAKASLNARNPRLDRLILNKMREDPAMDEEVQQYLSKNYYASSVRATKKSTHDLQKVSRNRRNSLKTLDNEDLSPKPPTRTRRSKSVSALDLAQLNNASGPAQVLLLDLNTWKFDIMRFAELMDQKPLLAMTEYMFRYHDLYEKLGLNVEIVENFFYAVEMTYKDVPYHNSIHGADVAQAVNFFLIQPSVSKLFTAEDIFVSIVAAGVHDVGHPGNNNQFEISTGSDLAVTYNDKSVLENFHIATCFRILRSQKHNIFANFSREKFRMFRSMMVDMILATDMQDHARYLSNLQAVISQKKQLGSWFTVEDKNLLLINAIHTADLSNGCRPQNICLQWTPRIYEEFWRQGDQERQLGLPISPLCDRLKPNLEKSQVGFLSFVIKPLYSTWVEVVPECSVCLKEMENNLHYWQTAAAALQSPPPYAATPTH